MHVLLVVQRLLLGYWGCPLNFFRMSKFGLVLDLHQMPTLASLLDVLYNICYWDIFECAFGVYQMSELRYLQNVYFQYLLYNICYWDIWDVQFRTCFWRPLDVHTWIKNKNRCEEIIVLQSHRSIYWQDSLVGRLFLHQLAFERNEIQIKIKKQVKLSR